MTRVLYIAGYGRSGSTILEIILSNHPEIVAVGEATFLLDEWGQPSRLCSCGARYSACEFWKDLLPDELPSPRLARLVRKMEQRSAIPRLALGRVDEVERQAYSAYQKRFFEHVSSRSGKSIIVDSSKSARDAAARFLALHRLAGQDVYVLHLVRSGLATMESLLVTGSNWALEGYKRPAGLRALRAAAGWVSANVSAALLGRLLGPQRYRLVRYEDLLDDPLTVLQRVGRFCGFDPAPLVERLQREDCFEIGHVIGGNRIRLQERVQLRRPPPARPGARLTTSDRLLFAAVGGWLHRHYGYD